MENNNYALMDVEDYSISYSQFLQLQINVSLVSCCLTVPKEYIHMSEEVLMNAHRFARLSVMSLFCHKKSTFHLHLFPLKPQYPSCTLSSEF